MPVVSNTSPLLNLAIVGRFSLLRDQFREIWIPPGVFEELRVKEDLPGTQSMREAIEAGWLRVEKVRELPVVQVLQRDLDKGEAEAITLALQMKAEWILLDEREARRVAKRLGLKVAGVLGILFRARREGKLSSLERAMKELREKAGFRIGADLFAELVREAGERS